MSRKEFLAILAGLALSALSLLGPLGIMLVGGGKRFAIPSFLSGWQLALWVMVFALAVLPHAWMEESEKKHRLGRRDKTQGDSPEFARGILVVSHVCMLIYPLLLAAVKGTAVSFLAYYLLVSASLAPLFALHLVRPWSGWPLLAPLIYAVFQCIWNS